MNARCNWVHKRFNLITHMWTKIEDIKIITRFKWTHLLHSDFERGPLDCEWQKRKRKPDISVVCQLFV